MRTISGFSIGLFYIYLDGTQSVLPHRCRSLPSNRPTNTYLTQGHNCHIEPNKIHLHCHREKSAKGRGQHEVIEVFTPHIKLAAAGQTTGHLERVPLDWQKVDRSQTTYNFSSVWTRELTNCTSKHAAAARPSCFWIFACGSTWYFRMYSSEFLFKTVSDRKLNVDFFARQFTLQDLLIRTLHFMVNVIFV